MTDDATRIAGLGRVRALVEGARERPGMWQTLAMQPTAVDVGHGRVEVLVDDRHANGNGVAHGGLLASVIDSACGMAYASVLDDDQRIATVDLSISYHRPALPTRSLRCDAHVIHQGRQLGHATAEVRDDDGRVLATGRAVFAVQTVAEATARQHPPGEPGVPVEPPPAPT